MITRPPKIGPYKLIEPIGKGGMAQVWRAQWLGSDGMIMPCAVKVPREEVACNVLFQGMFIDEARLSMRLAHANICRVVTASTKPCLYIVMEWVNGKNLAEMAERLRLIRQPLPYDLIRYIIHSLLLALDAAHTLRDGGKPFPIIHRDISPQNVMISVHGEVKLMDFGIARVLAEETSTEDYAGKLRYLPKEQLQGKLSTSIDLYAVGAILHELIEGTLFRPDCMTRPEMLEVIKNGRVPALTRPGVPDELRKLHNGLLRPEVRDRVPSARDGLAILGRVTAEQKNIGQIIATFLGPRATMSGSTLGDFEVPAELAEPDHKEHSEQPDVEAPPAPGAEPDTSLGLRHGEVIERTPTEVVPKPEMQGMVGLPRPEETSRSIPRVRPWPPAGLVGAAETAKEGNEEPAPEPPPKDEARDAEPTGPMQESLDDDDAVTTRSGESSSDGLAVTEVFHSPRKPRNKPRVTTIEEMATQEHHVVAPALRVPKLVLAVCMGALGALGLSGTLGSPRSVRPDLDPDPASLAITEDQHIEVEILIGEGAWTKVSPGNGLRAMPREYGVRWRHHGRADWQDAGLQHFAPGHSYEFVATGNGLLVLDTARPARNKR